ncbi:MAG: hypothetical protein AAF251_16060 [Pseudomonadota bacterium]
MEQELKCIEPLTYIAGGWGAYALGALDGGITVGAMAASGALVRIWAEAKEKFDLDSKRVLKHQRERILARWEQHSGESWVAQADVNAADERLAKHLGEAIPSAKELGLSIRDGKAYPAEAAKMIVDRIALRSDCKIFREEGHEGSSVTARRFALEVVEAALEAALEIPEYAQKLHTWFFVAINEGIGEANDKLDAILAGQFDVAAALALTEERAKQRHEALLTKVDQLQEQVAALVKALSEQSTLPDPILRDTIMLELEAKPGSTVQDLAGAVVRFKAKHDELQAELDQIQTLDNRLAALKAHADEAMRNYDHDAADRIFGEMRELEDERAVESVRRSVRFATSQAKARMLNRDSKGAAQVWLDASYKLLPYDAEAAGALRNSAGIALFEFGLRYPGDALETAVYMFRKALEAFDEKTMTSGWATAQNNLGNALSTLGERNDGVAHFDEAVAAYRASLKVRSFDAAPKVWAMTQNNLANVLATLGYRKGRLAGEENLRDAVVAYEEVLSVNARDLTPLDWANTQNNLGNCLSMLGGFVDGPNGEALLRQAESAYRAALEVRTRKANPVDWAQTNSNLGIVLRNQAERATKQRSIELLVEAGSTYSAALEVYTRKDDPVMWARTHENMAIALYRLALSDDLNMCEHLRNGHEAVAAALMVFSPDEMPFDYKTANALAAMINKSITEHCAEFDQS